MRLLVIDGNSIVNRAYYGVRTLSNRNGIFTNALFGFMNMYLKEVAEVSPDGIAVAFDLPEPTFRHQKAPSYKANRKGMPEELAMQMPYLKRILTAKGVMILSAEGYEADDILGTLAHACDEQGAECFLMTGDRDSLQLVSDHVTVHLVKTQKTIAYTPAVFREEYGFAPIRMTDLKALMGDTSDNISGIKGIGEKSAIPLIQMWETIENMYEHIGEVKGTPKFRQKLIDGKEDAILSKWLATIVTDAPISVKLSDYIPRTPDNLTLRQILTDLEMYRILERLKLQPLEMQFLDEEVTNQKAPDLQEIPFDMEKIRGFSQPVGYLFKDGMLTVCADTFVTKTREESQILEFMTSDIPKATNDAKPHYHYALNCGKHLNKVVFDASVCGYVLNPSENDYSVSALCTILKVPYFTELDDFAEVQTLQTLSQKGIERLEKEGMLSLWNDVELPLTGVLASMEHEGVLVDTDGIRAFGEQLTAKIEQLKTEIYVDAGQEFNISSPKQLGVILFEKLGLPAGKKTKSGYSTSAEVLEDLRPFYPIVDRVLQYRQYTKLQSTYVDGLLNAVAEDGRIHTNYKQTETRTGRLSSTEPNLQNIPVRTELGREMRKFFKAGEGKVFLDADYSQIELRLMAHLSKDKAMIEAFKSGTDIHTATAAKVFDVPEIFVTPDMRSKAKAVNFGILYGMGAFSLSKDIHVSKKEAERYIADYLGSFPKVSKFLDDVVKNAVKNGYVCTMLGRRRYIPELNTKNKMVQAAGKRIAMNTPVQGTAADLIKLAMIHVHDRLEKEVPTAKLLLQVHDELIVEVPLEDAEKASQILHEEMLNVAELSVPLTADVKKGNTWYDAKS